MNIEIVEFYLDKFDKKGKFFNGTLHIYLIDIQYDFRGIYVQRKGDKWLFLPPVKMTIDKETQEKVRYPVFASPNPDKNREFIRQIRELAIPYIKQNLRELFE